MPSSSRLGTPRASATRRGYDGRWQRARRSFLDAPANRFCAAGCGALATVVDHRVPHKGDPALFWSSSNWQPLCARCHSRKTAAQDGGFGSNIIHGPLPAAPLRGCDATGLPLDPRHHWR